MTRQSPTTTVAILGDDPVVDNALSLLLEREGYTTRIIRESLPGCVGGRLEGVDVVLLSPTISNDERDTLLSIVRGNPKTATTPVLALSTARKEVHNTRTTRVVPWPSRMEDLMKAIEVALVAPATNSQG